jgi:hypothetical protein
VAALVTRIDTARYALCILTAVPGLVDSGGRVEQTDVLSSLGTLQSAFMKRTQFVSLVMQPTYTVPSCAI